MFRLRSVVVLALGMLAAPAHGRGRTVAQIVEGTWEGRTTVVAGTFRSQEIIRHKLAMTFGSREKIESGTVMGVAMLEGKVLKYVPGGSKLFVDSIYIFGGKKWKISFEGGFNKDFSKLSGTFKNYPIGGGALDEKTAEMARGSFTLAKKAATAKKGASEDEKTETAATRAARRKTSGKRAPRSVGEMVRGSWEGETKVVAGTFRDQETIKHPLSMTFGSGEKFESGSAFNVELLEADVKSYSPGKRTLTIKGKYVFGGKKWNITFTGNFNKPYTEVSGTFTNYSNQAKYSRVRPSATKKEDDDSVMARGAFTLKKKIPSKSTASPAP